MIVKNKKINNLGFTLPELIVSIAIMMLIMGSILFNYRKFDSDITLTDLTFDVALSVRKAQSYGIGVQGASDSKFNYPYGVRFGSESQYFIFSDRSDPLNRVYDSAEDIQEITYTIQGKYKISGWCVSNDRTTVNCSVSAVDISFKRPDPDATIIADGVQYNYAIIKVALKSDPTAEREIIISSAGQISVQ